MFSHFVDAVHFSKCLQRIISGKDSIWYSAG